MPGISGMGDGNKMDVTKTTGCVITCHNYAQYLAQCLQSCIDQSLKFDEIIVVDDAGSDNAREIVGLFACHGVRYLRTEYGDVSKARNAGVSAIPWCNFILPLDGDNYLDTECHKSCRERMGNDWKIGVVGCVIKHFDSITGEQGFVLEGHDGIYDNNFARKNVLDNCALIRTEALRQAGGWLNFAPDGIEDWGLWLRITRLGWQICRAKDAVVHYRRHSDQMILRQGVDLQRFTVGNWKFHLCTAIITLFCGRDWALEPYFNALPDALGNANVHLVAVDNSGNPEYSETLQARLATCGYPYTYMRDDAKCLPECTNEFLARDSSTRLANGYPLNEHVAGLYARARQKLPQCEFVMCWEDDIVPPVDAIDILMRGLFDNPTAGASVIAAPSRYEEQWILFKNTFGGFVNEIPPSGQYTTIASSGFYCVLFWRDVFDIPAFRPAIDGGHQYHWYDCAFYYDIRECGYDLMLCGGAVCQHLGDPSVPPIVKTITPKYSNYQGDGINDTPPPMDMSAPFDFLKFAPDREDTIPLYLRGVD